MIRNALVAATEEMVLALRRSAYSTNIKTRSDFSCAFFDAELRAVAQGFTQPVHLGSMVEQTPRAIRDYGPENLGPGDVLIRDGVETRLPAKTTLDVLPGDTISYRTCGGGGYGPPADRDPARVARDVREGKVSAKRALEVYGWRQ